MPTMAIADRAVCAKCEGLKIVTKSTKSFEFGDQKRRKLRIRAQTEQKVSLPTLLDADTL